jgi:aquaporin related protein
LPFVRIVGEKYNSDSTGGTNATGTFPVNTTPGGRPSNGGTTTLYIALAFGFSLLVNAWIYFRISGSLFNPAVSLAMFLVGQITAVRYPHPDDFWLINRAILATVAQLIGGIVAAAMTSAILPGTMNVTTNLEGNCPKET